MPLDRRRRRARRRFTGPVLLLSGVTLAVLAIVIGGVLTINGVSAPYRRTINRSFAAQGSVLAQQSTAVGRQLRRLMGELPSLRRSRLQQQLDSMVAAASTQAAAARVMVPPDPSLGTGLHLISALEARARAVTEIRGAIDGLLGLAPLPVVGVSTTGTTAGSRGTTVLIAASKAIDDLQAAGASLERADQTYAAVRRALATAAGNGRLPRSVWVTRSAAWSPGAISVLVSEVTSSPTLATRHGLELVTVSLTPAAIPLPSGPTPPGGVTTVPPTSTLVVSVVLRDAGNVAERDVLVSASVRRLHGSSVRTRSEHVSLDPGASVAAALASLPVNPGHTYSLYITLSSPSMGGSPGPSTSYTVAVAPGTPASTTTTTTTTVPVGGTPGKHKAA